MTTYRFFSIKNVQAEMLYNFQKPVSRFLLMTSQWRFDKRNLFCL